jgi:hypothetical protein
MNIVAATANGLKCEAAEKGETPVSLRIEQVSWTAETITNKYETNDGPDKEEERGAGIFGYPSTVAAIVGIFPVFAFLITYPTYGALFSSSRSENSGTKPGNMEKQKKKNKGNRASRTVCFPKVPIFLFVGLFLSTVCASDGSGQIASQDHANSNGGKIPLRQHVIDNERQLDDVVESDLPYADTLLARKYLPSSRGLQDSCTGIGCDCNLDSDCDDDNHITIDTCNIIDTKNSACVYVCDDNDACTAESLVGGVCQYTNDCNEECAGNPNFSMCLEECNEDDPGLINCDDGDLYTLDVCLPQSGCMVIPVTGWVDDTFKLIEALPEDTYFFEDPVTITETEVSSLLKWIQAETVQDRTPFCWRRSYGRGVGKVLSTCPQGKEKIGALCYTPCEAGYSRQGTFDCQQECTEGFRDDGLFCRMPEYGRTAGYPWKFGDALNDSGMFSRCQRDWGAGKCEKYGLIVYPKCKPGYGTFGCCICRPSPTPDCWALGYNGGFDLSCAVYIKLGDPTVLQCKPEEEQDAGLCYTPCADGFDGVGPVCWQQCDTDQTNCGAGCANSGSECAFAVAEQVLGPLIIAANILTLGGVGAVDNAVDSITVAGKTVKITSKPGRFFLKYGRLAVTKLATNFPATKGSLLKRLYTARAGTDVKKVLRAVRVDGVLYAAHTIGTYAFAKDFEQMTTTEIAEKIDTLPPSDAFYVKQRWASIQSAQLAESQAWAIADLTLAAVGLVDPTGIVDTVNAYAKPKCASIVPFPKNLGANVAPQASCQDVTIQVDGNSNCKGVVLAQTVGFLSTDDSGNDELSFLLDGERDKREFNLFGSPYTTTMTVLDSFSLFDTCSATVTVTDPTPSSITCPPSNRQSNDPGECGASVSFDPPVVTNNCRSTSTTAQTAGLATEGFFGVETITNTFQVTDSLGNVNSCSFRVTVNDDEDPSISCAGLAPFTTLATDPGVCTREYIYSPPVGVDNCGANTAQILGPPFGNPFLFPAETTTNGYAAYDREGSNATCSFDVVIEDREKPTIECPVETIRPCYDTDPEKTGTATTTDNCDDESPPILTYSDDTNDGSKSVCPEITTRTWLSTDWKGNFNNCTQKIIEVEPDALTDSTLCLYDGDTINTIFTPDVTRESKSPYYKLSTTTPGQFVYHAFHVGAPGETVSFSLEIPYPFVTRGAKPVYAYDWLNIEPGTQEEPCFIPTGNRFFEVSYEITVDDYGVQECGHRKVVLIDLTTPGTGFIHLSIDLDLGPWARLLKRAGGTKSKKDYGPNQNDTIAAFSGGKNSRKDYGPNQNDAIDAFSKKLLLQDRCMLEFSVLSGLLSSTTTVESINVYKQNQGVAGFVVDSFQNPISGVGIQLVDQSGIVVGAAETDQDGYYDLIYKQGKKRAAYTVIRDSQSVSIEMYKDNAVVNFDDSGGKEEKEVKESKSKKSGNSIDVLSTRLFVRQKKSGQDGS